MEANKPCGFEIPSSFSIRTSIASADTDVTQVDSSAQEQDRPLSHLREIRLEHLDGTLTDKTHARSPAHIDGNSNSDTHKVCGSCAPSSDPEKYTADVNGSGTEQSPEKRVQCLMTEPGF